MTYEQKSEYLQSYQDLICRIHELEDRCAEIEEMGTSIAQKYDNEIHSQTVSSGVESAAIMYDKASHDLVKAERQKKYMELHILKSIYDMRNYRLAQIIRKRYLEDQSVQRLAEWMHVTPSGAAKMIRSAISAIDL